MSTENVQDLGAAIDPLNMDLSGTSTKYPVIVPGPYNFQVAKMEVVPNKSRAGTNNLKIELKLMEPAQDREGNTINPGFSIFHTIGLSKTEKYDPARNLAVFMDGVLGHHAGNFAPFEQYQGQTVTARVKIETSEQYGDQNRIDAFIKKA